MKRWMLTMVGVSLLAASMNGCSSSNKGEKSKLGRVQKNQLLSPYRSGAETFRMQTIIRISMMTNGSKSWRNLQIQILTSV